MLNVCSSVPCVWVLRAPRRERRIHFLRAAWYFGGEKDVPRSRPHFTAAPTSSCASSPYISAVSIPRPPSSSHSLMIINVMGEREGKKERERIRKKPKHGMGMGSKKTMVALENMRFICTPTPPTPHHQCCTALVDARTPSFYLFLIAELTHVWLLAYVPLLYDAEMPPRFISGMRTPGAISTLSFPIGGGCCSSFAVFADETVTERLHSRGRG